MLALDDGRTLSESFAILFYLAQGTAFWPADPFAQAQVLTWLSFEQAQHMRPISRLRLHLSMRRDKTPDDADMKACRTEALDVLRLMDDQLGKQGPKKWVATDHPSIADIALYPYTRLSPLGGLDLAAFPHVTAWLAKIEALPGYQTLFPGGPSSLCRRRKSSAGARLGRARFPTKSAPSKPYCPSHAVDDRSIGCVAYPGADAYRVSPEFGGADVRPAFLDGEPGGHDRDCPVRRRRSGLRGKLTSDG